MAEGTNDARDDLKQVYKEFAQPVGRSLAGFGCSFVLVALAALVVGARMSWPLGVGGGVLVIVLLILVSNRVEAPHKHRAKERVSQLEERYGLSHRESFALLASTRSGAAVRDKSEWNAFVTEVWGQSASTAAPKPPSGGTVTVDGVVDMLAEIYRRPENQYPRGIRPGSAAEKEVRRIGEAIDRAGGKDLMLTVHSAFSVKGEDLFFLKRDLERVWDGIGSWQG
jgi:hypothetical protein